MSWELDWQVMDGKQPGINGIPLCAAGQHLAQPSVWDGSAVGRQMLAVCTPWYVPLLEFLAEQDSEDDIHL